MQLSTDGDTHRTVIAASGDLDITTAPEFRAALHRVVDEGAKTLVVDLTGVGFLDSTTLGVLVGVHKRLTEPGAGLQLVCPRAALLRIFELTGLDRVFAIYPSLAAVPN
jgi:anti-sigma B factor antagonist